MNDCDFNQREREGICSINVLSESVIRQLNDRYKSEFGQTTTILIKIVQKTTIDSLTAAMNAFTNGAVNNMNVDATIVWNSLYRASSAATAGTGEWLWTIIGLLLTILLAENGYLHRGAVARALRSARDRLRGRPPPPQSAGAAAAAAAGARAAPPLPPPASLAQACDAAAVPPVPPPPPVLVPLVPLPPPLVPLPPSSLAQASDAAAYPPLPPSRATFYSTPSLDDDDDDESRLRSAFSPFD
uniref:Uncharacterized protein n=1 Tax=Plectus sambesii TaxID=2011161 RepID=A0A914WTZ3_9BILA